MSRQEQDEKGKKQSKTKRKMGGGIVAKPETAENVENTGKEEDSGENIGKEGESGENIEKHD